jgi:uncharacterized damage-inducible protein DinB
MIASSLKSDEYNAYYDQYLQKIPGNLELGILLLENKEDLLEILDKMKPEDLKYSYAKGKWAVAEVLQHLIDVERIFQYRALTLVREPGVKLPGFDHDAYVPASSAQKRNLKDFKKEFKAVRNAGIYLYQSFSKDMLGNKGFVSGSPTSCRALGFITVGHTRHHIEIFKEKYLIS